LRALAALLLAGLAACESAESDADAALPLHAFAGIRFRHPEGWEVSDDSTTLRASAHRLVSVEGPEDAILIIEQLTGETPTPEEYVRGFVAGQLGPAVAERGRLSTTMADVAGARLEGVRMVFEVGSTGFATTVFRVEGAGAATFVCTQTSLADETAAERGFAVVRRTLRLGD
jgi:hypothetical protein